MITSLWGCCLYFDITYLDAQHICVEHNMPMMRLLVYDWPADEQAVACEDEFMLGDVMLIAPLLEENAVSREVYLPAGEWIGFFDRRVYNGSEVISSSVYPVPVYIRRGYENQI